MKKMNNGENILPALLKRLRGSKSQAEIARLCGVSQSNYTRYESGAVKPKHDALCKIAMHFGLTVDQMLSGADPQQAANLDPHSKEVMLEGYKQAYDSLSALPDGKRYLGWLAGAALHAAESASAYHSGDIKEGQAKAYRSHAVLEKIFRTAEGE